MCLPAILQDMFATVPRPIVRTLAPTLLAALLLGGCGQSGTGQEMGTLRTAPPATSDPAPPVPDLRPVADGPCPYLSDEEASELNGEKVVSVRTDPQVEPPGCFFYTYGDRIQLTTSVFTVADEQVARRLVDESAPVAETERADVDGGWTGGKSGGPTGALLAVFRDDRVVVVQSTQEQSIKVQRVAERIIPRLG